MEPEFTWKNLPYEFDDAVSYLKERKKDYVGIMISIILIDVLSGD